MANYVQLSIPNQNVFVREHPSECPVCHVAIAPIFKLGVNEDSINRVQCCYQCTNKKCSRLFLVMFGEPEKESHVVTGKAFRLMQALPVTRQTKGFPDAITAISSQFVLIYNEAYAAEQSGLKEICGVGYRKSLEFLIKDYLIGRIPEGDDKPGAIEKVKNKFLGKCIEDDIKDVNIKAVAKRAAWLGNDETHYVRKWTEKDVTDLKKLISLTVNHMESEALTAEALLDMPDLAAK